MRRAALVLAAAGRTVLVVVAVTLRTTEAFTLGVASVLPSDSLHAGQTACQRPIPVPRDQPFDSVDFEVGNYFHKHGPPLDVTVRALDRSFAPRHGLLPGGYPDVGFQPRHVVRVGNVPGGSTIEVCIHNRGPIKVALFGNGDLATQPSTGTIDGRPIDFDFDLVFRRGSRTFATLAPTIARRASLFRPPWVSPALYYVLFALLSIGAPLLLARALSSLDRKP